MTIGEFTMREQIPGNDGTDKVVIPCVHHKTGATGLAFLVVTEEVDDMIQYYLNRIRRSIVPVTGSENYLFLTCNGRQYTPVYRCIKSSLGAASLVPPTAKVIWNTHLHGSKMAS